MAVEPSEYGEDLEEEEATVRLMLVMLSQEAVQGFYQQVGLPCCTHCHFLCIYDHAWCTHGHCSCKSGHCLHAADPARSVNSNQS